MSGLSLQGLKMKHILLMTFTEIKIFNWLCKSQLMVEMLAKRFFFLTFSAFEPIGGLENFVQLCFYYLTSGKR